MNLRDLTYFQALAKHGHFGRAATACHVSQPTLSTQLKKLEDELGAPLFERNRRQVLLTPFGEAMLPHAHSILNTVDDLKNLSRTFADPLAGPLKIGVIPTIGPYYLPEFMEATRQKFPKTELKIYELKTPEILRRLKEGSLDAGLMALPLPEPELKTFPLFSEPFLLATPPNHPLAAHKKISAHTLTNHPLLLLEDGHCFRNQALEFCTKAGGREDESFGATSLETLKHLVAEKFGITLVPAMAATKTDKLAYTPFQNPAPTRTVGLACRFSSPKKILLQKMAEKG